MRLAGKACPKCGKKTLSHPDHPHAFGWKQTGKIVCRSCKARFKAKHEIGEEAANGDEGR